MQIQIESTAKKTRLYGADCRVWKGVTAKGIECEVYVVAVSCMSDSDSAEFDAELTELPTPPELD